MSTIWELTNSTSTFLITTLKQELYYSAILFGLVLIAVYFLKNKSPYWHFGLWTLILIRLVLPPDLSFSYSARNFVERYLVNNTLVRAGTAGSLWSVPHTDSAEIVGTINQSGKDARVMKRDGLQAAPAKSKSLITAHTFVAGMWLSGVLFFLVLYVKKLMYFHGLIKEAHKIENALILQLVSKWRHKFSMWRDVRIVTSETYLAPFSMGIWRPTIYIPKKLADTFERETLEATIAHEMAHIKCLDALWIKLQNMVQIVYFFNPIVWYVNNRFYLTRESICDSMVISSQEITPIRYCRGILDVLKLKLPRADILEPVSSFANHKKNIECRIKTIIKGGSIMKKSQFFFIFTVLALSAFLVLPMAVTNADPQEDEQHKKECKKHEIVVNTDDGDTKHIWVDEKSGKIIIKTKDGDKKILMIDKEKGKIIIDGKELNIHKHHKMSLGKDHTPLMHAVFAGDLEKSEALLKEGADVNEKNKHNTSALTLAAEFGKKEMVSFLLDKGADINNSDNDGDSALLLALMKDHREIADILLGKGADIRAQNEKGHTPLMHAVMNGNSAVAAQLIKKGANVNAKDHHNSTPLTLAAELGQTEIVELLLKKKADLNAADDDGDTPLLLALVKKHTEIADILLKNGADVHAQNNHGSTTLTLAAEYGFTDIVKMLIKKGVDPNKADNDGDSPLLLTLMNNHKELTKMLLKEKADVMVKNDKGWTTLMRAADIGDLDMVKTLFKKGVKVSEQKDNGSTALIIAANSGHKEVIEFLLKSGANVNETQDYKRSALIYAALNGHTDVAKTLINKGAEVNLKDEHKSTALTIAAENGHTEIVKLLIKNGAEVNAKDKDGDSSLKMAKAKKHMGIVKLLEDAGATE